MSVPSAAVATEVEVWARSGRRTVALDSDRVTIGKDPSNDVALVEDSTVSQLHAALERFPAGWCVSDLGSTNGTFVNGERVWTVRRLQHGDELRLGHTRLVFRHSADVGRSLTQTEADVPQLTVRERDVLRALCRPLLDRDLFTEPSSVKEVALELLISEAAVKQHLTNLYAKFRIEEGTTHRRARLANEALRRGAISITDLHDPA